MKRLAIPMIFVFALMLSACTGVPAGAPVDSVASSEVTETPTEAPKITVGFSLAGERALSRQLAADIQSECDLLGISAQITTAASPEQQLQDISEMFTAGASVIVISPLDVDSLEPVLAESDTYGVRIINVLDPINGAVSTLISPDYKGIGSRAGQCAVELLGSQGGGCMTLCTQYDSFTMQMMSDGFSDAIGKDKDVKLVSENYCGFDEETAYSTTKSELSSKDIDFIFAQDAALARGAIRAIEESGKDVKLVVFGGDMDMIDAVSQGKAYACVFFGPGALAHEAVFHADQFLKSSSYVPPQYVELSAVVVKQADATGYYNEALQHAQIK